MVRQQGGEFMTSMVYLQRLPRLWEGGGGHTPMIIEKSRNEKEFIPFQTQRTKDGKWLPSDMWGGVTLV